MQKCGALDIDSNEKKSKDTRCWYLMFWARKEVSSPLPRERSTKASKQRDEPGRSSVRACLAAGCDGPRAGETRC